MASVVVTMLKKRSALSDNDVTAATSNSFGSKKRWLRKDFSEMNLGRESEGESLMSSELERQIRAAKTIQRTFRGFLMRQQLRSLVEDTEISNQSLLDALEIVARWHVGWSNFLMQLVVGSFLILTVYFQCFYYRPAPFDVNTSVLQRPEIVEITKHVTSPFNVYLAFKTLAREFYISTLVQSPFCLGVLEEYCATDSFVNDTSYETLLSTNCSMSVGATVKRAKQRVDVSNRLFGTVLIIQERAQVAECAIELDRIEEISSETMSRICLGDQSSQQYLADPCYETSSTSFSCYNDSVPTIHQGEIYTYNKIMEGFVFPLHMGNIRGLPVEALECKLDRMHRIEWLDRRTQDVCIVIAFLNKQEQGRLMTFKECFRFTQGGKVNSRVLVASTSLLASPTASLIVTWLMIGLILIKLSADTVEVCQDQQAQVRRGIGKRKRWQRLVSCETLGNVIPPLLILAACIVFLVLAYTVFDLRDSRISFGSSSEGEEASIVSVGMTNLLARTDQAVELWVSYTTIISIALLFALGKTLLLLDFHPTSAIVSGTLRRASANLGCFLLIFVLVLLVYAFVGMILLGGSRYEFSAFGLAVNTLLFVAIGEIQLIQDLIFYNQVDDEYVTVIQALFFWSYVLLVTILLMNVLLSIIVGAFVDLQERSEKHLDSKPIHSFTRSFYTSLRFWVLGAFVRMKRLYKQIKVMCKRGKQIPPAAAAAGQSGSSNGPQSPTALLTPWERLLLFSSHYLPLGTATQPVRTVRRRLERILHDEQSVELIIVWCRQHTRIEKLHRYGYHLRGLDPDSDAIKGRTVYLLESIMKRLGHAPDSTRMTMVSTQKSLGSSFSKATNTTNNNISAIQQQRPNKVRTVVGNARNEDQILVEEDEAEEEEERQSSMLMIPKGKDDDPISTETTTSNKDQEDPLLLQPKQGSSSSSD